MDSGGEGLVQFFEELGQMVAEELVGFSEAAFLIEGCVVEVIEFDAETGGDVVADEVEP